MVHRSRVASVLGIRLACVYAQVCSNRSNGGSFTVLEGNTEKEAAMPNPMEFWFAVVAMVAINQAMATSVATRNLLVFEHFLLGRLRR